MVRGLRRELRDVTREHHERGDRAVRLRPRRPRPPGQEGAHPPPAGDEGARREDHHADGLRHVHRATFDEAGIDLLLVGDSASNNVYGNETSLPVTVDELLPLTRAVARSVSRAMVVGDLPFGSYQASPEQGYLTAVRFMKEAGAHCVKLEGGAEMAPVIEKCTRGGIPVMAHIGFTPQSEHTLGGYRVQGRGETGDRVLADAHAVQEAGAFAVVMEMVPGDVAEQITKELAIPTIGIGAGTGCDGQVLVWQDAFGLRTGRMATLRQAVRRRPRRPARRGAGLRRRRRGGTFPGPEHTF